MGLAYASLNDHIKAKQFYEKAIELDPHNESFRNNLRIAEEKARESQNQNPFSNLLGNMNLDSIMQNPAVMSFAQRMMSGEAGGSNLFSSMMNSFGEQSNLSGNQNENNGQQNLPDLTPFFRA